MAQLTHFHIEQHARPGACSSVRDVERLRTFVQSFILFRFHQHETTHFIDLCVCRETWSAAATWLRSLTCRSKTDALHMPFLSCLLYHKYSFTNCILFKMGIAHATLLTLQAALRANLYDLQTAVDVLLQEQSRCVVACFLSLFCPLTLHQHSSCDSRRCLATAPCQSNTVVQFATSNLSHSKFIEGVDSRESGS